MSKGKRSAEAPLWFDGKSINEALFCDDFLGRHRLVYMNGAFFTPDGRVTDELPLRGEVFEALRCCARKQYPAQNKQHHGADEARGARWMTCRLSRTGFMWQTARSCLTARSPRVKAKLCAVAC